MSDFELHDRDVLLDETFDAVHEDSFAGEDPDEDYLQEEANRGMLWHEQRVHEGGACDCGVVEVPVSNEAPF